MALYTRATRLGISVDDLLRMVEEQQGFCAICGAEETLSRSGKVQSLALDHNHETGEIRGLLCSKCNLALGLMDDNPDILRAALAYLTSYDQGGVN
jgi:Recombination endonuclease VII